MKKVLALTLALIMTIGYCFTAQAAVNTAYHAYDVKIENNTLLVTGFFYNNGNIDVSNFRDVELTVMDAKGNVIAKETFNDNNLRKLSLMPGEAAPWTFGFDKYVKGSDLSKWTCYTKYTTTNGKEHNLGTDSIHVFFNGRQIKFDDVAPTTLNGRTMVPIRKIAEVIGATVGWDNATKEVTLTQGNTVIRFKQGEKIAKINDKQIELDAPSTAMKGRTMVPIRFVAEAFNCFVTWGNEDKVVGIYR